MGSYEPKNLNGLRCLASSRKHVSDNVWLRLCINEGLYSAAPKTDRTAFEHFGLCGTGSDCSDYTQNKTLVLIPLHKIEIFKPGGTTYS